MAQNIQKLQVVIPPGEILFDEGDTTKEMYILLKGCVEVLKGDVPIAFINESGSFIGEMATLLNAPRTARVRTKDKSVMLKVAPEDVDVLFKVTPELGYNLSKSLAERLALMTEKAMQGGDMAVSAPTSPTPSEQDIEDAEAEMSESKEAPKDPKGAVKFLTRTEVHKDVMRYVFNHLGINEPLENITRALACPESLIKLILSEFKNAKLVKVEENNLEFVFQESFIQPMEDWIFQHGLFRKAS